MGEPHIVFCHEWMQIHDGTVCEMQLSRDLSTAVTAPRELWKASDYKDVKSVYGEGNFVTDGPFMVRKSDSELYCIWSTFNEGGYAELICIHSLQDKWRKGYGSKMMNAVLQDISTAGFSKVMLWVFEDNKRARRFYEAHGFTTCGKLKLNMESIEICYEKNL